MENKLTVPQGDYLLLRSSWQYEEQLRAWDAADEYVLEYLAKELTLASHSKILVLNDSFGALTVSLSEFNLHHLSDSFNSQQVTKFNLSNNDLAKKQIEFLSNLHTTDKIFDLVLIKIPKTLALLEAQLSQLQANISQDTKIISAGMVKNMPANAWKLLEKYIGSTTTSLAKKKARLIFTTPNPARVVPPCPYPVYYTLENTNYRICNHANVFSRESLDIGTRFLIKHLPEMSNAKDIIDLGCGNGVIGLKLAETHPNARIHFVDESYMAIASAKETFETAFPDHKNTFYHISDALNDYDQNSADLIVCNPPFHQHHANSDQIALRMFSQAKSVLRKNGELWIIGNRHLNYHQKLKNLFGNSSIIASNPKFVICKAIIQQA
ncbi:MAG: methyltransferase [Gammaproteobacteria bacterium]